MLISVFDQRLDLHIGVSLMPCISQDKAVQSRVHHRCNNLYRELYPHTLQMAGPDQRVGVSLHLSRQFRRWLAQLFAIRRGFGCRRETAAGNDDQYLLPEPADGDDDRGEWIGCSAAKDLSECSGKEPGGSCRDERSEYLQSHSDFLQKDASASMNTGKTPADMFFSKPG